MTIELCWRNELADYYSRRRSAFPAGTVKRNTPLRFRLGVTRRMALQGRVECTSRARCNGAGLHLWHLPCVRKKWTFLWRSGYLPSARIALHHPHHAVMLPISCAAGGQVVFLIRRCGKQRRA